MKILVGASPVTGAAATIRLDEGQPHLIVVGSEHARRNLLRIIAGQVDHDVDVWLATHAGNVDAAIAAIHAEHVDELRLEADEVPRFGTEASTLLLVVSRPDPAGDSRAKFEQLLLEGVTTGTRVVAGVDDGELADDAFLQGFPRITLNDDGAASLPDKTEFRIPQLIMSSDAPAPRKPRKRRRA